MLLYDRRKERVDWFPRNRAKEYRARDDPPRRDKDEDGEGKCPERKLVDQDSAPERRRLSAA